MKVLLKSAENEVSRGAEICRTIQVGQGVSAVVPPKLAFLSLHLWTSHGLTRISDSSHGPTFESSQSLHPIRWYLLVGKHHPN